MENPEQLISNTIRLAKRSIELLTKARDYRAQPYFRQALAILGETQGLSNPHGNRVAKDLLRMAVALLDQNGEGVAAAHVEQALEQLGEPFPPLSEYEMVARLDWWEAKAQNRRAQLRMAR